MPNNRKSLKSPRARAFQNQNGRCFYCDLPMWLSRLEAFVEKHSLTAAQASIFKCTGEHLQAKCQDGKDTGKNIVAACWYCNSRRHRRRNPLSPDQYKKYVQKRINAGKWSLRVLH